LPTHPTHILHGTVKLSDLAIQPNIAVNMRFQILRREVHAFPDTSACSEYFRFFVTNAFVELGPKPVKKAQCFIDGLNTQMEHAEVLIGARFSAHGLYFRRRRLYH